MRWDEWDGWEGEEAWGWFHKADRDFEKVHVLVGVRSSAIRDVLAYSRIENWTGIEKRVPITRPMECHIWRSSNLWTPKCGRSIRGRWCRPRRFINTEFSLTNKKFRNSYFSKGHFLWKTDKRIVMGLSNRAAQSSGVQVLMNTLYFSLSLFAPRPLPHFSLHSSLVQVLRRDEAR